MAESLGEAVAVAAVAAAVADVALETPAEDVAAEEPAAPVVADVTLDAGAGADIVEATETLPTEGSVTIPVPEVAVQALEAAVDEPAVNIAVEAPVEAAEDPSEAIPAVTVVVEDESGETAVAVEAPAGPEDSPAPVEPIARPKSPWTPSYSVVRQGSMPPEEVEELEQLPPPIAVEVIAEPEVTETTIPVPIIVTEVVEEPANDLLGEEVSLPL